MANDPTNITGDATAKASGTRERADIEKALVEILEDMTSDWDTGFAGKIGPQTKLMGDLTFESIDVVMLIVAIEERFERKGLPFEKLLMTEGRYVDDVQVDQVAAFLETNLEVGRSA